MFYQVFGDGRKEDSDFFKTNPKLVGLEEHERYGLPIIDKSQLMQYLSYMRGL